jgi:hypothetical protein
MTFGPLWSDPGGVPNLSLTRRKKVIKVEISQSSIEFNLGCIECNLGSIEFNLGRVECNLGVSNVI